MSIWISKVPFRVLKTARLAILLTCFPLMACFGPGAGGSLGFLSASSAPIKPAKAEVLRSVALYGGDVVVSAPKGYCIDRESLKRGSATRFVLLASCESLSGVRGHRVEPAIMTLTVMPTGQGTDLPTPDEIAKSNSSADVLSSIELDNLTMVHLSAGGDTVLPDGDPRHWRGATVLNDHLIGMAVYAKSGTRKAGKDGHKLLEGLAQSVHEASPKNASLSNEGQSVQEPSPATGLGTLLGGLFPKSS